MTPWDWFAVILSVSLVAFPLGVWFGRSLERELVRERGEQILALLRGFGSVHNEPFEPDEWKFLPYVATRRAVARAMRLPDPHPTTRKGSHHE